MRINADFTKSVYISANDYQWVKAPQAGIERMMLDRIGEEKARATSIVRYAPKSFYPLHAHPGGEEILVLSGCFLEGKLAYTPGWYLRNPPGSVHQPSTEEGAVIFVKLWQMQSSEQESVRINTNLPSAWQTSEVGTICPLFSDENENVCLRHFAAQTPIPLSSDKETELLIFNGSVYTGSDEWAAGSWIRLALGDTPPLISGTDGVTMYYRTGQLFPRQDP